MENPAPAVNLLDLDLYADGPPHDLFTWLRNNEPVHWHPSDTLAAPGFWVVTKYWDVINIERDAKLFSSAAHGALFEEPAEGTDLMLINQDPPQHTRLRNLVARAFTPRVMKALEPHIRDAAGSIVHPVREYGECDFVTELAAELPLVVICELMGVPVEERHKVFDWSNRMIGHEDPEFGTNAEDGRVAALELYQYAQELADDRKASPRDDIVTTLVTAELDGEKLTDVEFNAFFLLLAVAGNETTRNLISGGMLTLFEHPDQRALLESDLDAHLPGAVDEMLRYVSPVKYFRRTATADTEVRGVPIRSGDNVTLWYGAANRDEEIFDDPQTFDVTRSPNEHIAFGGRGPHYCLGVALAKLEIRVMFEEILTRLPGLEPAGGASRLRSLLINGIKHMPVRWAA
ncbi:MAG: cytochrome P450 [Acidimicrobiia bacterium]|nr:cytochrome P450 [Acidimicrobiia bacterium]